MTPPARFGFPYKVVYQTVWEDPRFNRQILNENNANEKQKHGELLYFVSNSFLCHFIYQPIIIILASPESCVRELKMSACR